jgi:hypothetical protein
MITSGTNTYLFRDGTAFIVSSVAGQCACGRMSFLFTNKNGKTFCLRCENERMMVAPSECDPTDDGPDAAQAFQRAIV